MKYLVIDYGTKRVGIATSDDEGGMAFPFRVISNTKKLVEEIGVICRLERIGTIIIGESRNFQGKQNPIMRDILPFAEELKAVLGLPVLFMNEVYSSQEAARITGDNSANDASAAALVLQSYLDRTNPPQPAPSDEEES
jgi:putative Holliday junction resolvase